MIELAAKILVPRLFQSREEGKRFLELFLRDLPAHTPQRYGKEEPLRSKFRPNDVDLILEDWGPCDFIADRRRPDMYLQVYFSRESLPKPRHTWICLHRFQAADWKQMSSLKSFLIDSVAAFRADLAVAHILTGAELSERIDHLRTQPGTNPAYMVSRVEKEGVAAVLNGMTVMQYKTENLSRALPDLPWLTVFGQPYVEMFGRARIETVPAYEVKPISTEAILVNVTRDLPDTEAGWGTFKVARDRCKRHLNTNAFFDPTAARGHLYRVPEFRFPIEMYRAESHA